MSLDWADRYEDMRDWQYREENPGYEREVAYTPDPEDPDRDPDIDLLVADIYARDNAGRRERNLRTENTRLRQIIEAHGIEIPEEN